MLNLLGPPANLKSKAAAAAAALNAGVDVNDGHAFPFLVDAVAQNLTTRAAIDRALNRSLSQLFQAGVFDPPAAVSWTSIPASAVNSSAHQKANYDAALQAMVLLRNDGGAALPLAPGRRIAVLGPQAEARSGLLSDYATEEPCFGGGDACIPSIADAIRAANGAPDLTSAAAGVDIRSLRTAGIAPALALARAADHVVLCLGIDKSIEHEGVDREELGLPGLQELFAERVLRLGKPTTLVLTNGGALAIDELAADPRLGAIVEAFNPGGVGARALAALVMGRENRWGKLPVTVYPKAYARQVDLKDFDMAKPPGRTYKWYGGTPLWPFGSGLSLTSFAMNCSASSARIPATLACTVFNTGGRAGDEVVMAFQRPSPAARALSKHPLPIKRLIDFGRVTIPAGGTATVAFEVTASRLAMATDAGATRLYPGPHEIELWRGNGAAETVTLAS